MAKVPVGETVGFAYNFAISKFFANIGIIWLPLVLLGVIGGLLSWSMGMSGSDAMTGPAAQVMAMQNFSGVLLLFYVVYFAVLAMIVVGITELALGLRKPSFFYVSFGAAVWRLLGANLLLLLIGVLLAVALMMSVGIVAGVAGGIGQSPAGGVPTAGTVGLLFLFGCVAYGALIYIMVRLGFLLTPVVVAEHRLGLGRSWELSRGNFWRLFAVLLAVVVPVSIFLVLLFLAVGASGIIPMPPVEPGQDPEAARQAMKAWADGLSHNIVLFWGGAVVFGLAITALYYGLLFGAAAGAYRALVPAGGEPM